MSGKLCGIQTRVQHTFSENAAIGQSLRAVPKTANEEKPSNEFCVDKIGNCTLQILYLIF